MNRPSAAELTLAKRLLAYETAAGRDDEGATTAAGRVHDKVITHWAPLVGAAGVHALLARSVKLTARLELAPFAEVSVLEGATKFREWLETQEPEVVAESAAVVFGTFFALLTTLIGERLTTQVLRKAWPTLEAAEPNETKR